MFEYVRVKRTDFVAESRTISIYRIIYTSFSIISQYSILFILFTIHPYLLRSSSTIVSINQHTSFYISLLHVHAILIYYSTTNLVLLLIKKKDSVSNSVILKYIYIGVIRLLPWAYQGNSRIK